MSCFQNRKDEILCPLSNHIFMRPDDCIEYSTCDTMDLETKLFIEEHLLN